MAEPIPYAAADVRGVEDDRYQLRVVAVCHYVWGGLMSFGAAAAWLAVDDGGGRAWLAAMGGYGLLAAASGRLVQARRLRGFSLAVAAATCLVVPLGTVLGVLTIVTLGRRRVAAMYRGGRWS